jgi:peroxiredoxin
MRGFKFYQDARNYRRIKMARHSVEKTIAPDFTLVDTGGKEVCLSDFRGRHPVVLVFNRGFA